MIQICEYAVAKSILECTSMTNTDVVSSYYLYLLYQGLLSIMDRLTKAILPEKLDELAGIQYQSNPERHEVVMILCESVEADSTVTNDADKRRAIQYTTRMQMTVSSTVNTSSGEQYTRSSTAQRNIIFTPTVVPLGKSKEMLDSDRLYDYIRVLTSEMIKFSDLQFAKLIKCEPTKTVHYHLEEAHPYVL